jgi:hypothetical protein
MNKRCLPAIEIEALAPSALTAPDNLGVSLDGGDYPSNLETRGRTVLRRFIETLAFAGCSMAGVYVGVWLEEPNDPRDLIGGKDETSPRQRGVAATHPDGWPF